MSIINRLIKGTEVRELFEKEAICMGSFDIVLESSIEELFGKEVAHLVRRIGKTGADLYYIDVRDYLLADNSNGQVDPNEDYLSILVNTPSEYVCCVGYSGFEIAVAEHNKICIYKSLPNTDCNIFEYDEYDDVVYVKNPKKNQLHEEEPTTNCEALESKV